MHNLENIAEENLRNNLGRKAVLQEKLIQLFSSQHKVEIMHEIIPILLRLFTDYIIQREKGLFAKEFKVLLQGHIRRKVLCFLQQDFFSVKLTH